MEKSLEKSLVEAWKNSEKSAVVGGGEGLSKVKDAGEGRQLEEAGLMEELGVPTSIYLKKCILLSSFQIPTPPTEKVHFGNNVIATQTCTLGINRTAHGRKHCPNL